MGWTQDANTGVWTQTGSTRAVVIAEGTLAATARVRLQCSSKAHNVKVLLLNSPNAKYGFEVGIEGTNTTIRSVRHGVPFTGTHNPAAGDVKVLDAHSLGSGPFIMEVEYKDGVINLYLNGASSPNSTFNNSTYKLFSGHSSFGFVSVVDGAKVLVAEVCELVPILVQHAEIGYAIAGGNLYAWEDESNISQVATLVARSAGPIITAVFDQKVYIAGQPNMTIFDPVTMSVTSWVPDTGTLPGQGSTPGTSTATFVGVFGGRVGLNDIDDPQNIYFCAVGNPLNWELGTEDEGGAQALNLGIAGKLGEPVVGFSQANNTTLLVGCTRSFWRIQSDWALGPPSVDPVKLGVGLTSARSMAMIDAGVFLAHTTAGVAVIGIDGSFTPLSQGTLTTNIQEPAEPALVQVVRDAERHGYLVLLPSYAGGDRHYFYSETIGGFARGQGGFYPEGYASWLGPSCAGIWRGRVIFGGLNGFMFKFEDGLTTDGGQNIWSHCPVSIVVHGSLDRDTILRRPRLITTLDSSPIDVYLMGGRTAQEVYSPLAQHVLWHREGVTSNTVLSNVGRAPALVAELWCRDGRFEVEAMTAELSEAPRRMVTYKATSVDPSCPFVDPNPEPPVTTVPPSTGPGPGGSGVSSTIDEFVPLHVYSFGSFATSTSSDPGSYVTSITPDPGGSGSGIESSEFFGSGVED
ncbi:MAG: hypothetical protein H6815_00430 [Phycisphaeraceae bacterium]|nr:hypothetical protein [Phycisphaerales bacterium]MCB9858890.1 hypothetical protein [Phycisphaeraceae bacterium]